MRSILLSAAAIILFTVVLVVAQITSSPSQVSADPLTENVAPQAVVAAVSTSNEASQPASPETDDVGFVTTPSGLKYREIEVGSGNSPNPRELVSVHYTGTLPNGKVFDSSLKRGEPITFPIGTGRVIKGWDEGLANMKVGGKRELVIPPDLAYGSRGIPGAIPPNSTLIFEVELLDIL